MFLAFIPRIPFLYLLAVLLYHVIPPSGIDFPTRNFLVTFASLFRWKAAFFDILIQLDTINCKVSRRCT